MKHRLLVYAISLIAIAIYANGCAQAPATVDSTQPNEQRAGQGDVNVASAAGDAQSGIGDNPNRHGNVGGEDGASEVEGEIVEGDRKVTFRARGHVRTLNIGLEVNTENTADATVSGTTTDTAQRTSQATDATLTPTADNNVENDATLDVTP